MEYRQRKDVSTQKFRVNNPGSRSSICTGCGADLSNYSKGKLFAHQCTPNGGE